MVPVTLYMHFPRFAGRRGTRRPQERPIDHLTQVILFRTCPNCDLGPTLHIWAIVLSHRALCVHTITASVQICGHVSFPRGSHSPITHAACTGHVFHASRRVPICATDTRRVKRVNCVTRAPIACWLLSSHLARWLLSNQTI